MLGEEGSGRGSGPSATCAGLGAVGTGGGGAQGLDTDLLCSHLSRRSLSFSFFGKTALGSAPEDREHMGVSGALRAHSGELVLYTAAQCQAGPLTLGGPPARSPETPHNSPGRGMRSPLGRSLVAPRRKPTALSPGTLERRLTVPPPACNFAPTRLHRRCPKPRVSGESHRSKRWSQILSLILPRQ